MSVYNGRVMAALRRLVTFADVDDDAVTSGQVSVSARHEAELADGTRVLLLDDRGWGSSASWVDISADEIRETTRMVVGPDEPSDDHSHEDMAAGHWAALRDILRRHGIVVDATELRRLPHDILLSERLRAHLG